MPIIQLLLMLGILSVALVALRGGQSAAQRAFWRLSAVTLAAVGLVSVMFPNVLTRLAHLLGIGRGTDLLLYLAVVAYLMALVIVSGAV